MPDDELRAELPGDQLVRLLDALGRGEAWQGEVTFLGADGKLAPARVTATPVPAGGEPAAAGGSTGSDAPGLVGVDVLAALPDRRALTAEVDAALASPGGLEVVQSAILLEVGSLDLVSDAFGLAMAERVVRCCAEHLVRFVHPGDRVARFSERAFAVWCPHGVSTTDAQGYGDELRRCLGRPDGLPDIGIALGISAAFAVATPEVRDGAELLQRSDTALLRARLDSSTLLYEAAMRDELMRRVELEAIVGAVIDRGTVDLAYQPIVRLADQRTVGAEALLRVVDATGTAIPAIEVVQAAEQSGQIDELGDLILRTACSAAAGWRRQAPERPIHLAVNVSPRQLDDPTLPDRVTSALAGAGLEPSALWLEITESALMRNPARSASLLAELRRRGVQLAADDFGTGYSSLASLKTFPLEALKIDRSFVSGIPDHPEDAAITRAILAMAEALGLDVVAEGVEHDAQRMALLELGAVHAQGYRWSPAVPAEVLGARLAAEARPGGAVEEGGRQTYNSP